jgi:hypothetical protein
VARVPLETEVFAILVLSRSVVVGRVLLGDVRAGGTSPRRETRYVGSIGSTRHGVVRDVVDVDANVSLTVRAGEYIYAKLPVSRDANRSVVLLPPYRWTQSGENGLYPVSKLRRLSCLPPLRRACSMVQ